MKSARRKKYLEKKTKVKKTGKSAFWLLIVAAFLLILFLFLKFSTKVWNGKDRASFVYKTNGGDIGVMVFNPVFSEMTTLLIPGDTQVEVARNYGTLLIKNVWQFGINEKIGGDLLAETVTQNFLFPTYLWCEKDPGLDRGNLKSIIGFIFFPGETNIAFGDRLKIGLFSLNVKSIESEIINLGESRFLDKRKLNDGSTGYVLSDKISERLTIYFSDNDFNKETVKINIIDATGEYGISEKLGEILEVLGGKIVSIDKRTESEEIDCTVSATNKEFALKVARLFSCKVVSEKTNFDLDIKIGSKFAERF